MNRIPFFILLAATVVTAQPLTTFTVRDPLGRHWENEIVHFQFSAPPSGDRKLTDAEGRVLPAQFTTGGVWTVTSLAPGAKAVFQVHAGKGDAPTDLRLEQAGGEWILSNDRMALRVPQWPGAPQTPGDLAKLPAPLLAVRGKDGAWLGGARWFDDTASLKVKEATTTVVERGPVRIVVQQRIVLADGRFHSTTIELGARQEVAVIREDSDINVPTAGWRWSMQPGLSADHVFWHNQWRSTERAGTFAMADTAVDFTQTNVVAKLRPWSFWWIGDITIYAGFYKHGATPFVGLLMMNPSRWTPGDWDGFERLEIPILAGPNGQLEMSFAFLANRVKDAPSKPVLIMQEPDTDKLAKLIEKYPDKDVPLHREWGITVGTVAEHVLDPKVANPKIGTAEGTTKLRRLLLKHGEFPLDEVKDYGFDFPTANDGKKRPFLLVSADDIARVRRQAKTNPALQAHIIAATNYIARSGAAAALEKGGRDALLTPQYRGIDYIQKLSEAYLGSDDPLHGKLLAAAVMNMTLGIRATFVETPVRPALVTYGPWPAEEFTKLLFAYDLVADTGLLSAEDRKTAYDTLVFGAQLLANRDYWWPEHGLSSANPNMTSMIRLPLGLLGMYLKGHPSAAEWEGQAVTELEHEVANWIAPGGAFIECPGYQQASIDGMLLMATALRNVGGKDYLVDPRFKATMEYYGFLLTPPDVRFPPRLTDQLSTFTVPGLPPPATLPTIGDTPVGSLYPFHGWMAQANAATDPAYSKRQQFYWKLQNFHLNSGNRAKGFTVALNNVELPAEPPKELSRGFPSFGSVMRTSWTDPKASYVALHTGPFSHHYHHDQNSFHYYAKGVPMCLDFGNQYQPIRRDETWYHNRVSFEVGGHWTNYWPATGELMDFASLPATIDYSYGKVVGKQNQENHRHLLLVKSADPLGANYVVVRDRTVAAQPGQSFFWNLWSLSKTNQVTGAIVHFPGQLGVDLDAHVLLPTQPQITTDYWKWKSNFGLWGAFEEEQHGMRISASKPGEFFVVLYPRVEKQGPAEITALADGAAARIKHMEGTDVLLVSPGKPATASDGGIALQGEVAFARRNSDGTLRLALVKDEGAVSVDGWKLAGTGPVAIEIKGGTARGESDGPARSITVTGPGGSQTIARPAGPGEFTLDAR